MFRNQYLLICFLGLIFQSTLMAQKPVISGYFGKKSFIGFKYNTALSASFKPNGDAWLMPETVYSQLKPFPLINQYGLEYGRVFSRHLTFYSALKTTRLGSVTGIDFTPNDGSGAFTSNAFASFRSVVLQVGFNFKSNQTWTMPPVGKYAGFHLFYAKALEPTYHFVEDQGINNYLKYEDCDCTATLDEDNKTGGMGLIFVMGYRKPLFKEFYYHYGLSLGMAFGEGDESRLITRARRNQFFALDFAVGKLF